jgi:hypothetical protein
MGNVLNRNCKADDDPVFIALADFLIYSEVRRPALFQRHEVIVVLNLPSPGQRLADRESGDELHAIGEVVLKVFVLVQAR